MATRLALLLLTKWPDTAPMLVLPVRRPLVLSWPATALVVAKVGNSAVLVADRTAVTGVHDDGTIQFYEGSPRIFLQENVAVGFAGQLSYESSQGTIYLQEEVTSALSLQDPRTGIRRLFEEHVNGMLSGRSLTPPPGGVECPTVTIAVTAREFDGAVDINVVGLTEDGLARAESLNPFGGGAFAPEGPLFDALRYELTRVGPKRHPEEVVDSLAKTIRDKSHHAKGAVTLKLDAVIVKPGQNVLRFEVPFIGYP